MFGKKNCSRCDRKVDKDFDFCPYCANSLKKKEDYGLLGKNDDISELDKMIQKDMGNILGSSFMEKMLGSAMKMVEKEMIKAQSEQVKAISESKKSNNPQMKTNFELFINGKKVSLPGNIAGIQIEGMPNSPNMQEKSVKTKIPKVSGELIEKSAKLPRKEAKAHLARTSDKVVYELDIPGLSSLNNVLVNKLENSIEIKAYTEKAVYFKTLPVKLPLMQYSLRENKLVLEFKAQ
jgi:hypothetical protein